MVGLQLEGVRIKVLQAVNSNDAARLGLAAIRNASIWGAVSTPVWEWVVITYKEFKSVLQGSGRSTLFAQSDIFW